MARLKRPSPAQLREKRAQKMAIALSGVFLVVLVVQVPKLMKTLNGGATPAGGTVAGALPAGVNPTLQSHTQAATPVAATIGDGHLTHLSRFAARDPFHALVSPAPTASAGGATAKQPAATKPAAGGKQAAATPSPRPTTTSKAKAPTASVKQPPTVTFNVPKPKPNAAIVKTNGEREVVFVGDGFPTSEPLFKLVKLGKKNDIQVGVLSGSFTSGTPTIKLVQGRKLILANEADGSRYVVELVKLTSATPPAPSATPQATTTTAAAATTTTDATTTPAAPAAPATPTNG